MRKRWDYAGARKHADEAGFAISMPMLSKKSGAESQYRFKFEQPSRELHFEASHASLNVRSASCTA